MTTSRVFILQATYLVTGHDEPHVRQQAERTGAFAYLPKPWAGATLLAVVARAFGDTSQDKEH